MMLNLILYLCHQLHKYLELDPYFRNPELAFEKKEKEGGGNIYHPYEINWVSNNPSGSHMILFFI